MTDPLDATAGIPYPALAELRAGCPVSRTESGAYFLARYDDVLGATKSLDAFQASFREPGVVVPPEEQAFLERVESARVADDHAREPVPVFWANGLRRLPVVLTGTSAR